MENIFSIKRGLSEIKTQMFQLPDKASLRIQKGGETMQRKICQKLYEQGKWSIMICGVYCNKLKQLKCDFLDERNIEEANLVPAGFVDRVKFPLHPDLGEVFGCFLSAK